MDTITSLTTDFLNQRKIAVVGVSSKKETPANAIYRKLKSLHYEVFAVNRSSEQYNNDACYHDLQSIPSTIDGVIIVTRPENSEQIVEQCIKLKIPRVWMHCAGGTTQQRASQKSRNETSSVSERAVQLCREHNIAVIPGACPMMFCQSADFGHKMMRWVLSAIGKLRVK